MPIESIVVICGTVLCIVLTICGAYVLGKAIDADTARLRQKRKEED